MAGPTAFYSRAEGQWMDLRADSVGEWMGDWWSLGDSELWQCEEMPRKGDAQRLA